MEELFAEILALCLDRVTDGDNPSECAAEFPEFPDLLPLLRLAGQLSALRAAEPDPAWLTSSRDHLVSELNRHQPR